jgi:general nucleoside transport system ATP-binding protein
VTDANAGAQGIVLRLDQITKRFGALVANDAINLTLQKGEVVALLGENGAGKTTLMNILFGHYTADQGEVTVFGTQLPPGNPRAALAAGIGMVHQHFTLADNLSVLDNICLGTQSLWHLGRGRAAARARLATLSHDFGLLVDPDALVGRLTVGQRQRVEILKALYRDARILILDEPTAVLTPQETDALFETLRRATVMGLSTLFISHKLHEVMAIASRCVVLRQGRVVGEVPTAATDPAKLAALMVGGHVAQPKVAPRQVGPLHLRLNAVSTKSIGTAPGLQAITINLCAGQIIGLAGVSGNGQAALADVISGLAVPSSGQIDIPGKAITPWTPRRALQAGIARIPEDRHKTGTVADFSLVENAALESYATAPFSRFGWMNWRAAQAFAARIILSYDVRCPGPQTRIRLLSGGNMQKLILGRALEPGPSIILAHQPVRGLDVGAIAYVHGQLIKARDAGAAILLISEDLDEIIRLADVIHVISEGRLSPGFARGSMTAPELGIWMAGHGFGAARDAA